MAAGELNGAREIRGVHITAYGELLAGCVRCYVWLWAVTVTVALLTALLLAAPARSLLALAIPGHRAPAPSLARVLALAAHNGPIAAWPLGLAALGARECPLARRAADVTVLACAFANIAPVALALGGYGSAIVPYLPQLPLEWAALAAGYGSWLADRKRPLTRRARIGAVALTLLLSLLAGVLETVLVPHR